MKRYNADAIDGIDIDTLQPTDNLIIKGNNQVVLSNLLETHRGKVKLIYIDPPYNTGNKKFVYNDSMKSEEWLSFMQSRLVLARQLLREDGCIFVSIDDNEQAYLKVLMDEVFGRQNFVADFIRKTKSTTNNTKNGINIQHENLICFAYNKNNIIFTGGEKELDAYKNPDNDINGEWVSSDATVSGGNVFTITNPYTGIDITPPAGSGWRFSYDKLEALVSSGAIVFDKEYKKNRRGFIFKRYKKDLRSIFSTMDSLCLTDNKYMNQAATKELYKLFPNGSVNFPKPEALIERIIECSTNPGDLVLDFFLGSGTTAAVAHKMNRQYIGVEQMDYIDTVAVERLKKVIEGEQGGISKSQGWSGGGSFVRMDRHDFKP